MNLDRVTITGADDSITPEELIPLSERYPFVEWGILFSGSRQGSPRYPTWEWVGDLVKAQEQHAMNLSAHLCGRWVRELVLKGKFSFPAGSALWPHVQRVQLNFHGQFHKGCDMWYEELRRNQEKEYILQYDGVNDPECNRLLHSPHFNAVPLFDKSGGAGVVPNEWPSSILSIYCGYAGGLGPKNLAEEIRRIEQAAGDERIWIDMETKVRSDGDRQFDLEKVKRCLELAKPFVTEKGGKV